MQQKCGLLVNIPVTSGPWHSKVLAMVAKGFPVRQNFLHIIMVCSGRTWWAKPVASLCIERDSVYQNVQSRLRLVFSMSLCLNFSQ